VGRHDIFSYQSLLLLANCPEAIAGKFKEVFKTYLPGKFSKQSVKITR
jgi:hypothetical protein